MPFLFSSQETVSEAPFDSAVQLPESPNHHVRLTRKQKTAPVRDANRFYSCREGSNTGRVQYSNLSLNSVSEYDSEQPAIYSCHSIDISPLNLHKSIHKRMRAKTPVFAVGQLESLQSHALDAAEVLAEQYRAILPSRVITPLGKPKPPKLQMVAILNGPKLQELQRKSLRRIKGQQNLHSLGQKQSRNSSFSDTETLVGSGPGSPLSTTYRQVEIDQKAILGHALEKTHVLSDRENSSSPSVDDDIALNICVDLLTSKLATSLSRQHPLEDESRSSGLQVLLMIEAYEKVQKNLRQKLYRSHRKEGSNRHLREVDRILEYWLQVLYSVYGLTG
jgi:hypothetical protein